MTTTVSLSGFMLLAFTMPLLKACMSRSARRQEHNAVTAFLDHLAQQLNSGEQFVPNKPFDLQFVHLAAGPRGSRKPSKKLPDYEYTAQFDMRKNSIVHIPQDNSSLCCPRAIITARGLHLGGNNPRKKQHRLHQATNALLAEAGLRAGPMGCPK